MAPMMPAAAPRVFLLQSGRIQHHQASQLAGQRRRDDLTAKPELRQQWQPAAVIEMRVRQRNAVDTVGIEAERVGILMSKLAAALQHPAIDQDTATDGLDQMAGAGDRTGRTVE